MNHSMSVSHIPPNEEVERGGGAQRRDGEGGVVRGGLGVLGKMQTVCVCF